MNWRRGIFRVWIVLSISWLLYSAWKTDIWLVIESAKDGFPSIERIEADRSAAYDDCFGKAKENGQNPFAACDEIARRQMMPRETAIAVVQEFALSGVAPPLIALAAFGLLLWIVKGFKSREAFRP
jgi:hypothetical protein